MRRVLCSALAGVVCGLTSLLAGSIAAPKACPGPAQPRAPVAQTRAAGVNAGPPPVVVKAYGCDRQTGQCDLIIAYVPGTQRYKGLRPGETWVHISTDGKLLACGWGGRSWCRAMGGKAWRTLRPGEEWHRYPPRGAQPVLMTNEEIVKRTQCERVERLVQEPSPSRNAFVVQAEIARGRDRSAVMYVFDGDRRLRASFPEAPEARLIAWSPDGSAAAIGIGDSGDRMSHTIIVLDCKTFEMRREVFKDRPIFATWSPDGKCLALVTSKSGDRGCSCGLPGGTLAIFDPTTSRVERYPQYSPAGPPTWSPDSRHFALQSEGGLGAWPTYVFDVDSRHARAVPAALREAGKRGEAVEVRWSPDGRRICYDVDYFSGEPKQDTWVLEIGAWGLTHAGRKDAFVPRDAKPGNYVCSCMPAPKRPQVEVYCWRAGWHRLGQVTRWEEWDRRRNRSRIFVGRIGKPGRMLVVDGPLASASWTPEDRARGDDGLRCWRLPG